MNIGNIDRLLLFREVAGGSQWTQSQLHKEYKLEPDGSNLYYGFNQANLDSFQPSGQALNPSHQAFFADIQSALQSSQQDEKTVVVGLEPSDVNSFDFVALHMDMLTALARELADQISQASAQNKRLQIIIRYASEMNDAPAGDNTWGRQPDHYKASFQQVRAAFRQIAPDILFSFSPALRHDVNESLLTNYWPGDEYVDIIAGTWYVRGMGTFPAAKAVMNAYFLHRVGTGKSFGLSEVGGCDDNGASNDQFLQLMLHELEGLQIQNVSFKYVTLFLQNEWGSDATLGFLPGS